MKMLETIKKTKASQFAIRTMKAHRASKLKCKNFTIIANNCWGGVTSEYFNLRKNSPTVGLYFFAEDYIKFVYNLAWYIAQPLGIIPTKDSKYFPILVERVEKNVIIGKLHDIEIVFLHYHSPEEAIDKWNRRCKRINWDCLFIKFSEMNLCSERELQLFDALPFENKVMFTHTPRTDLKSARYYPGYEKEEELLFDTNPVNRCINLVEFLNQPSCVYKVVPPKELLPTPREIL
jgi:uncharacterized protein (DUF1919 family)